MTRIALVEDDAVLRDSISILLQRMGHTVETHENGSTLLEDESDFEPEVVLTDIIMPGTDGLETIRKVVSKYPDIRIIAMSGGATGDNPGSLTRWAKMVGAHDAIAKPFTSEQLKSSLALVLDEANPESTDTEQHTNQTTETCS